MSALFWIVVVSSFHYTGSQHLSIAPFGTQIKNVDSGVIFTCSLISHRNNHDSSPNLRWMGPNRRYIKDTKGRVYLERQEQTVLRLYITRIQENDAGLYTCEADVNGRTITEETRMFLYEDIEFAETPTLVQSVIGSSPLLECQASGQPEPEISWRFNSRKIMPDNVKYQFEEKGLRINGLDLRDNGTYECRAEVGSHGNLKVRTVTVDILYAPVMLRELPSQLMVMKGRPVELSCEADGNPSITYEWYKEQRFSDKIRVRVKLNTPGKRHVIIRADSEDEGRYFCKVTNSLGFKESSASLALIIPPRVGILPQRTVAEGGTVVLPCEASGFPLPNITWLRNQEQLVNSHIDEAAQQGDARVSVDATDNGINKLVIHEISKTDAGYYSCVATNEGGSDSQNVSIIVEFKATINITGDKVQMGWPGHVVRFTCAGYGLPVPTMTWLRHSDVIVDSDVFTITTVRTDSVVKTSLEIKISERPNALFGDYMCVAKNPHGYFIQTMQMHEAQTPDLPSNVSVLEETPTWVRVAAEQPRKDGGMPVNRWKITYEHHTPGAAPDSFHLIFQDSHNMTVVDLKPGSNYTFYLSAGNAVGFGKPTKFRVRTSPRRMLYKEQADVPRKQGESEKDTVYHDPKGKKPPPEEVEMVQLPPVDSADSVDGNPFQVAGGLSGFVLAMSVGVAVVFAAIVLAVVCFVWGRRRHRAGQSFGGKGTKGCGATNVDDLGLLGIQAHAGVVNGRGFTAKTGVGGNCGGGSSSRKNSQGCYASPTPLRACALQQPSSAAQSPHPGVRNAGSGGAEGGAGGTGDSLQRMAWETMIQRQSCFQDHPDRPLSVSELPPPPPFLLDGEYLGTARVDVGVGVPTVGGGDGYRCGDCVDDDIDEIDYTIRVPSFTIQHRPYP